MADDEGICDSGDRGIDILGRCELLPERLSLTVLADAGHANAEGFKNATGVPFQLCAVRTLAGPQEQVGVRDISLKNSCCLGR